MKAANSEPSTTLGLWGDGDEIAAIQEVEERFGVRLDYSDAAQWLTAGDVFASLQCVLPSEEGQRTETWVKFVESLSAETGVDPSTVQPRTLLLGKSKVGWQARMAIAIVAGLLFAAMLHW